MITLLLYDISNDRIRNKVAQICLDYGLGRIQYSAFLGDISSNRQEELWLKCRRQLGQSQGNLQLFILTPQDLAGSRKYIRSGAGQPAAGLVGQSKLPEKPQSGGK